MGDLIDFKLVSGQDAKHVSPLKLEQGILLIEDNFCNHFLPFLKVIVALHIYEYVHEMNLSHECFMKTISTCGMLTVHYN